VIAADWPNRLAPVAAPAPTVGDVMELLQSRWRPAFEASIDDLDFVPTHTALSISLPGAIIALPGPREVDAADLLFLRAALCLGLYLFDALEDLVLEVDAAWLATAAATVTPQDLLARFPQFGARRSTPAERTKEHLADALDALVEGYRQLNIETDGQDDDLVVFSSSFDVEKRDRWQGNLEQARQSLRQEGGRPLRIDLDRTVESDLASLLGGLDPRALAPSLSKFEVLAGSLPDPTLGGLLPAMTQDGATRLFHAVSRFALAPVPVTIDGDPSEWPAGSEALLPTDALGDAGGMEHLDLERLFLAVAADDLLCRLSLGHGEFAYRPGEVRVYGFELRPQRQRPPAGGPVVQVAIEMTVAGPQVSVRRDGVLVSVRHQVAVAGPELEIALDRAGLLTVDEPVRDRVIRAFSTGQDGSGAVHSGDRTRRVLIRF
jgi:hypothetical protein